MQLTTTQPAQLETLKSWFTDKRTCYRWGGPRIRFPFTHETFLEDIQWQRMPAYSLLSDAGKLIGFGQYYEKSGRCHLARLTISPNQRGVGIGQRFIAELMKIGMAEFETEECSLFVLNYNSSALQCYLALGFSKAEYPPGDEIFKNVDFMVYRRNQVAEHTFNSTCRKI